MCKNDKSSNYIPSSAYCSSQLNTLLVSVAIHHSCLIWFGRLSSVNWNDELEFCHFAKNQFLAVSISLFLHTWLQTRSCSIQSCHDSLKLFMICSKRTLIKRVFFFFSLQQHPVLQRSLWIITPLLLLRTRNRETVSGTKSLQGAGC